MGDGPATTGDRLTRVDLSREAIRLAREVTELMPDEAEAIGLLALMLLSEARRPARTATDGSVRLGITMSIYGRREKHPYFASS